MDEQNWSGVGDRESDNSSRETEHARRNYLTNIFKNGYNQYLGCTK